MKTNTSKLLAFKFAALLAATSGISENMTAGEKGLKIAMESDRRDTGFGDTIVEMEMVLTNRHGESSNRKMELRTLEGVGDGDKTLITFDEPRDVKGTAFLSYTHKVGADDQWLYLPALKRVKRIASSNKSGPFVGSEFAYEDMTSQEVEKYTYKYIGDDNLENMKCFQVERYPEDPKSGYTRQVGWIEKEHYRVIKIDFYDRKDSLLKTLSFSGYQQYMDKYWRADSAKMINHQTGKSTELLWRNYKFGNGYTERDFDQRSLQNAR